MARVGFKKTYPAGTFDAAALFEVFGLIRTTLVNAGFTLQLDTPDTIDVLRMGAPAGTMHDDVPHWAFVWQDQGTAAGIDASAVFGLHVQDAAAFQALNTMAHTSWLNDPPQAFTLWFVADGVSGGWWLNGTEVDPDSPSGWGMRFASAGTTSRRYPADHYQGLCARYGIWDAWGNWLPAYAVGPEGVMASGVWVGTWSPFGEGWSVNGYRHLHSPLPKMAVPQFPNRDGGITACILGELNDILILTDGYALEETVIPGWLAFIGTESDQPYAVPAPAQFDVL